MGQYLSLFLDQIRLSARWDFTCHSIRYHSFYWKKVFRWNFIFDEYAVQDFPQWFKCDLIFTSEKSLSKSFLIVSIMPSLAEMLVYDGLYLNVKIYGFKQFQSENNFSSIIIDVWGIVTHWYKISRIDFTHSYNIFCKNAR